MTSTSVSDASLKKIELSTAQTAQNDDAKTSVYNLGKIANFLMTNLPYIRRCAKYLETGTDDEYQGVDENAIKSESKDENELFSLCEYYSEIINNAHAYYHDYLKMTYMYECPNRGHCDSWVKCEKHEHLSNDDINDDTSGEISVSCKCKRCYATAHDYRTRGCDMKICYNREDDYKLYCYLWREELRIAEFSLDSEAPCGYIERV